MLRRFLNWFRFDKAESPRLVPSAEALPELWRDSEARLDVLDDAPTQVLTTLCDDYWDSFLPANDEESVIRDSRVHYRALEILAARGNEALRWARQRLTHTGYDAREDSASLIAQWAERDLLRPDKDAVARELVTLAVTPPEADSKEAQAASVALHALSIIGGPHCMAAVREVLTSSAWDEDDNQWECAEILSGLTNQPFMDSEDPVAAAKSWLKANST
jgi:hypothetical protein